MKEGKLRIEGRDAWFENPFKRVWRVYRLRAPVATKETRRPISVTHYYQRPKQQLFLVDRHCDERPHSARLALTRRTGNAHTEQVMLSSEWCCQ